MNSSTKKRIWKIATTAWGVFVLIATVTGFVNDTGLNKLFSTSWIWPLLRILTALCWVIASVVVLSEKYPRLFSGKRRSAFTAFISAHSNKWLTWSAKVVFWGLPLLGFAVFAIYGTYRAIPPSKTVVLVADFVDPTGVDSARVTKSLVEGMNDILKDHPEIEIKRLRKPVESSEEARKYGNDPRNKAAFVIWGDYTLQPEPEVHVRFDILRQTNTYFGDGLREVYGPTQTLQPRFFDFKIKLSQHLGGLVAFASGLALFNTHQYNQSLSLFNIAVQANNNLLVNNETKRVLYLYRSANLLALGRINEAESTIKASFSQSGALPQVTDDIDVSALSTLGVIKLTKGNPTAAENYLEKVLSIDRAQKNRLGEAQDLNNLGLAMIDTGNYDLAQDYFSQSLTISSELDNKNGEAAVLGNLGSLALLQGYYERAAIYLTKALDAHRESGNRLGEAACLGNLGIIAAQLGEMSAAMQYYKQALEIDREIGNLLGEANQLGNIGNVEAIFGNYDKAISLHKQALSIHRELGNRLGEARELGNIGLVEERLGNMETATMYYKQALSIDRELQYRLGEAIQLGNLGLVAFRLGNDNAARDYLEQSLTIYEELGIPVPEEFTTTLDQLSNMNTDTPTDQP